jgi:hypothetical protein
MDKLASHRLRATQELELTRLRNHVQKMILGADANTKALIMSLIKSEAFEKLQPPPSRRYATPKASTHPYYLRPRNAPVYYTDVSEDAVVEVDEVMDAEEVEVEEPRSSRRDLQKSARAQKLALKIAHKQEKVNIQRQKRARAMGELEERASNMDEYVMKNGDKLVCGLSKVVVCKDGLLELCRGDKTWSSFKETRMMWATLGEWLGDLEESYEMPVLFVGSGKVTLQEAGILPDESEYYAGLYRGERGGSPAGPSGKIDKALLDGPQFPYDNGMDMDGIPPVAPGVTHATLDAELDAWRARCVAPSSFSVPDTLRFHRSRQYSEVDEMRDEMERERMERWCDESLVNHHCMCGDHETDEE